MLTFTLHEEPYAGSRTVRLDGIIGMEGESLGPVALIGSGELADGMAEVHRSLMARLREPAQPVFVDTLAGFEVNIDQTDEKAKAYFKRNFDLDLTVARYRATRANPESTAAAVNAISTANYIFAGPGSPSYGIRVLRDSPVLEAMITRWREGALLVFASAAAITAGAFALPVYEIYKAGHDVAWIPGLDLLGRLDIKAAVVPHWNNNSGDNFDTRFCYMGAARMDLLERQLPGTHVIIGIDEYTTLVLDGARRSAEVLGLGHVTLRHHGRQVSYSKGQQFSFGRINYTEELSAPVEDYEAAPRADEGAGIFDVLAARDRVLSALSAGEFAAAADGLTQLSLVAGLSLDQGIFDRASSAVQALQMLLPRIAAIEPATEIRGRYETERTQLLDLLLIARRELRNLQQWDLADMLRERLLALGYTVADTPAGSTHRQNSGE